MRRSSILILVVAVGFAVFIFYSLFHVEPVQVTETRLERVNGEVFVDGELRNRGGDVGPIDVEVHYFDANGRALGQDKIVVKDLKKGAETHFRSPPRMLSEASQFSIYLNHGRNPYGN